MENWPPGFRFYPAEEELIGFYLKNKIEGTSEDLNRIIHRVIPVVDIYEYNPWDLPRFSENLLHQDTEQWFFFVPRRETEARGGRPSRLTTVGYWKATGSPGHVYSFSNGRPIGGKRTMVFYMGRAPHGSKTEWRMNEYTALDQNGDRHPQASTSASSSNTTIPPPSSTMRQEYSLCRVYKKSSRIRSFDRRPPPSPPPLPANHPPVAQRSTGNDQSGTTPDQNSNDQKVENASTTQVDHSSSSSSGDHGNTMMPVDDVDWESLDLFFQT